MSDLTILEHKFLWKLAQCDGGVSHIENLKPNLKTPAAKCARICQDLASKHLVEYDWRIVRFKLTPPGRVLLSLDTVKLRVTPDELSILRRCRGSSMTPEQVGGQLSDATKQKILLELLSRKLLKVTSRTITEVRLTEKGRQLVRQLNGDNNAVR
ncbi:MAG: hypothetical protein AB8B99_08490 [Phormidesmis sp.]